MKSKNWLIIVAALALPLGVSAKEEKKELTLDAVPAKVGEAIKTAAAGAAVKIKKEKEDGVEAYEAKWEAKGSKHEITAATDGTVLSEEEVIALETAPAAVQTAVKGLASSGELLGLEKATAKGVSNYEAAFKTTEGKLEVKMDKDGKELSREAEKKKAEKSGKGKKEKEEAEEEDGDED